MDVYVFSLFLCVVLCVAALELADPPSKGPNRLCKKDLETEKKAAKSPPPQSCRTIDRLELGLDGGGGWWGVHFYIIIYMHLKVQNVNYLLRKEAKLNCEI
jgi:hypothetical protein